jgi:curved DNA-binding protein CbpA
MHSHYENLKVPRNASQAEIKAAYRRLRSEHHPDRNKDPRATHRMQIINDAWDVLSNPAKRAKHDAELSRHEMFDEFFREMEEKSKADEETVSTEDWEEPEEDEKIAAMQRYFEIAGEVWMRESRLSNTYAKVEPTYRVYRTDFTVGSKLYYFYACYKSEIVQKWAQVKKELGIEAGKYSSDTLSPRLANQELMNQLMAHKGVLWIEGEPRGDVTGVFFQKGCYNS